MRRHSIKNVFFRENKRKIYIKINKPMGKVGVSNFSKGGGAYVP